MDINLYINLLVNVALKWTDIIDRMDKKHVYIQCKASFAKGIPNKGKYILAICFFAETF